MIPSPDNVVKSTCFENIVKTFVFTDYLNVKELLDPI